MKHILVLLFLLPGVLAAADCEEAYDGMQISKDTRLCSRSVDVPNSISITANDITLDCNKAILRGTSLAEGQGIILEHVTGVTVKECTIINFNTGILVKESNRNTIIDNTLLKNNIGIRLIQSFENRFENNADKSHIRPVSAIASKFNSFWLTNKDLDRAFCEVNLCNQAGPMNPCADNDFYCSPSCTAENDQDCAAPEPLPELPVAVEQPLPAAITELPSEAVRTEAAPVSFMGLLPEKARFWVMAFVFIITYVIGFLAFQLHHAHARN